MREPSGFGPKSAIWLAEIGIHRVEDLAGRDLVEVYLALKARRPREVTLNMLWALAGWSLGCPWNDLPPDLEAGLRERAVARRPDVGGG